MSIRIPKLDHRGKGFTLPEVFVSLALLGILFALILPAVDSVRETARRVGCQSNLRDIGLALGSHSALHGKFPYTSPMFRDGRVGAKVLHPAISPHQALLPWIAPAMARILVPNDLSPPFPDIPPFSVITANNELLKTSPPTFRCPSDTKSALGNSYRANLGTSHFPDFTGRHPLRRQGAFVSNWAVRPAEFTDGLSTTAMFSEKLVGDADRTVLHTKRDRLYLDISNRVEPDQFVAACAQQSASLTGELRHDSFGGSTWLFGGTQHTWYNHLVPPNPTMLDCSTVAMSGGDGIFAARSSHSGGVNVLFADGCVRFVTERIDLGIWRAAGTRNGREPMSDW